MIDWAFLATLLLVHCAGLISPGPDFLLVAQHALRFHRSVGIAIAAGLAIGLALHSSLAIIGVSAIITSLPWLFIAIQFLGGAYLGRLGLRGLHSAWQARKVTSHTAAKNTLQVSKPLSFLHALQRGLLTNLLNPKVTIFFLGLMSSFVPSTINWPSKLAAIALLFLASFVWFSLLALFFSSQLMQRKYLALSNYLDLLCSTLFTLIGLAIAFTALESLITIVFPA